MSIRDRLREERERLGMSQTEFGAVGDVGKTTVQAWERGAAFPNAAFLEAIAARGADVRYIVTGARAYVPPPPLSAEEQTLVDRWREASREVKNAAMGALLGASLRHTHQEIKGPVGSVLSTSGGSHTVAVHMDAGTYAPKPASRKRPAKR